MKARFGDGTTEFGPGVVIEMSGQDVADLIFAGLEDRGGTKIGGPRMLRINGQEVSGGEIEIPYPGVALCGSTLFRASGPSPAGEREEELERKVVLKEMSEIPTDLPTIHKTLTPQEVRAEIEKIMTEAVDRCRRLWDKLGISGKPETEVWIKATPPPDTPKAAWEKPGDLKLDHVTEVPASDLPPRPLKLLGGDQLNRVICELLGWTDVRWEHWAESSSPSSCGFRGLYKGRRQCVPNYWGSISREAFLEAKKILVSGPEEELRYLDALRLAVGAHPSETRAHLMSRVSQLHEVTALVYLKRPELFQ